MTSKVNSHDMGVEACHEYLLSRYGESMRVIADGMLRDCKEDESGVEYFEQARYEDYQMQFALTDEAPLSFEEWKAKNESQIKYLNNGGLKCPYCGAEQIEGHSIDMESSELWQEITCNECGKSWSDLYRLVAYLEDKDTPEQDFFNHVDAINND